MDLSLLDFPKLKSSFNSTTNNAAKISLGEVISKEGSYLNEFSLYLAHFNIIPNYIVEIAVNCKRSNSWFVENYKQDKGSYLLCNKNIGMGRSVNGGYNLTL